MRLFIGAEDCAGQVTGRALGDGGRMVSYLNADVGWRLLITGTWDLAGFVTVVEWAAVFDLITDCFLFFPISSVPLKQTVRYC